MKRDVSALDDRSFDVVVVGGGIYGACIARDSALRGLSVALIDKSDFGSATSHNSLKIVHGGIRYFQHLDFVRVRESINERRFWLSMAPHLVKPIEFVIPTFGYAARGPIALGLANLMHRIIGWDWNRGVSSEMKIGMGGLLSKGELESRVPGLPLSGVSGAATWVDGQMEDADRVLLECIEAAAINGACVANYVDCTGLLHRKDGVYGVEATDSITGRQFEIRCKQVVNACGSWGRSLLSNVLGKASTVDSIPEFSRNINVVTRKLVDGFGFGVSSKRAGDGVVSDQSRLYFITPWKNVSIIGTTHFRYDGKPDDYKVEESEICEFLDEINAAYPPAKLNLDDVVYVYGGLTPIEAGESKGEVIRSRHGDIIDHESAHGLAGIISVVGVKYTTARLVAERVVDLICRKEGINANSRLSRLSPLPGAERVAFPDAEERCDHDDIARGLLRQYGCNATKVLNGCRHQGTLPTAEVFRSCVRYATEHEMATCLADVIYRRTDLGPRGLITNELLQVAADEMSRQFNWSTDTAHEQITTVKSQLRYAIN